MNKKTCLLISISTISFLLGACKTSSNSSINSSIESSAISLSVSEEPSTTSSEVVSSISSQTVSSSGVRPDSSSVAPFSSSKTPSSSSNKPSSSSSIEIIYRVNLVKNDDFELAFANGKSNEYKQNDKVQIKATSKNSEAVLDGISVTGSTSSNEVNVTKNGDDYEFIMPNENVQVRANVSYKRYTITAPNAASSYYSFKTNGVFSDFKAGDVASFTVTPDSGYELVSYSAKGATTNNPIVFTDNNNNGTVYFVMPNENVIVDASVQKIKEYYLIAKQASTYTTITIDNEAEKYAEESQITFSVNVTNEMYELDSVVVTKTDGTPIETVLKGDKYSFEMPSSNVIISTTDKPAGVSGDPFAGHPTIFEGEYDYNAYDTLYYMRIRFQFLGNGFLNWWLTYDYDDYEDWWTKPNIDYNQTILKEDDGPTYTRTYSVPSDMEGSLKDGFLNCSYEYTPAGDGISFLTGFRTSSKTINLRLNRNDSGNIISLTILDNFDSLDGYWKTANVTCNKK